MSNHTPSISVLTRNLGAADPKTHQDATNTALELLGSGVVVVAAERDGRASLLVAVSEDLATGGQVHAGDLSRALAPYIDGRGGGIARIAQAVGPRIAGIDEALNSVAEQITHPQTRL